MNTSSRINTYSHISTELACLSDQSLSDLLNKATPIHSGIGGNSVLLSIDSTSIFVKKIALTDLEKQSENIMSTANLFNLPLYYQYGVGSAGFGAWRELVAHIMTTNWVISGECPNFPVMYHWRILPDCKPESMNAEQAVEIERQVEYWNGAPEVRNRLEAINASSASLVIFSEYIPHALYQWLSSEFAKNDEAIERITRMVETNLNSINAFMKSKGFVHFDAHFANILTNGRALYLTDFGLALSSEFDLSNAERAFLSGHKNYDLCQTYTNLVNWIVIESCGRDNQKEIPAQLPQLLQKYGRGQGLEGFTTAVANILNRYADITIVWNDFFDQLRSNDKKAIYPTTRLENILSAIIHSSP